MTLSYITTSLQYSIYLQEGRNGIHNQSKVLSWWVEVERQQ